jgi:glycosyltransferase involved in cell wall biosynthesis
MVVARRWLDTTLSIIIADFIACTKSWCIMKRYRDEIIVVLLFLADLVCLGLVTGGAIYLRYNAPRLPYPRSPSLWGSHLALVGVISLTLFPALVLGGAYRAPRRWGANEALPVAFKALALAFPLSAALLLALRFGVPRGALVPTPSRLVVGLTWGGLLVGLTATRLLTGRAQLALYRKGRGVRRAIIVGDAPQATSLKQRLERHPWLGEQVVGRVGHKAGPDWLGPPANLADVLRRQRVDVIWLAPPAKPQAHWLPELLLEPQGDGLIWRMLPGDFARLAETALSQLPYPQLETFYQRLQHHLALPTLRVAMLGSRGVPANYSGVEKYVQEVGSYLARNGAHVAVYCHAKYVSQRGNYRGMALRFVPTIPTKHLETITHTFLATLHALLQGEEVFHYQAIGPATLAWLPRLFGRKVVATVQGLDWDRAKWGRLARWYLKFGEWATCHFPHVTIVVSQTLARHYAERHGKETVYIPNGFEPPVPQPARLLAELGLCEQDYVLFVGRLSPEKGCHTLIRAFAQVQTDKRLVLAGRATFDERYYERLLGEARGLDRVLFTGFVQGDLLRALYSNAYLVVLPSELEGLSVSLLEALSYDNCLLVSNVPENLEAVGSAGHSFRTGDSADLSRKLQWLLDRPEQVARTRAQVRARASGLMSWEAVAEMTYKLLKYGVKQ